MKPALLIALIFLALSNAIAQVSIIDSVHHLFLGDRLDPKVSELYDNFEAATPRLLKKGKYNDVILAMFHSRNIYMNDVLDSSRVLDELKQYMSPNSKARVYESMTGGPVGLSAVALFDSMPAIITAYGITPRNKEQYRYRVLQDQQKEVQPWREINAFCPVRIQARKDVDGTAQRQMAYLGSFLAPVGNSLTVEIKNLLDPDSVYRISAVWVRRAPAILGTYRAEQLKDLIDIYKYQWKHDQNRIFFGSNYYGNFVLNPVNSLLRIDSVFDHNQNNLFFYLKDKVRSSDMIEYDLIRGNDSSGWKTNDFDPNIIWLKNMKPGNYTLKLRYAFQRQTVSEFNFIIKAAWYQQLWFKLFVFSLIVLMVLFFYLLLMNRQQKIRLQQQQITQDLQKAEINTIRNQFNPHFAFNALSSIQGLITQGKIDETHTYLNNFSILLRNSLLESEKEYISLSKDVDMMHHYIKLEQLRFNFQYTITIDEQLDQEATEVPVLLLQPVIENAIKHGISGLYEKGRLFIHYRKAAGDMIMTVEDNGIREIPTVIPTASRGLRLTEERVKLINKTRNGQFVEWRLYRDNNTTKVEFIFKNWFI